MWKVHPLSRITPIFTSKYLYIRRGIPLFTHDTPHFKAIVLEILIQLSRQFNGMLSDIRNVWSTWLIQLGNMNERTEAFIL